ncbi:MAG: molybdopterin dinucleotide binding domain-containing protein [Promethearchaeota archaeon]
MALRDFLYPYLEVILVLARALDVDEAQAAFGSLSEEYQQVAARIRIAPHDAQRLNLKEEDHVLVNSDIGSVVVVAEIQSDQPAGMVVMHPGPWAFALIEAMIPSQGTEVTIKPSTEPVTPLDQLL